VVTAAAWVAGGALFALRDERNDAEPPAGGWPGVTVLIPALNEEGVIGTSVRAALASDYPELEVLVLDDGSTDATSGVAAAAGGGDPRLEVVRDEVNRGKAEQLNGGFERARHDLVVVTDADTHLHPRALRLLVARIERSPRIAAVAGAPHVTNRDSVVGALQILEAAAVIGLIRRTHAVAGRVGTVAGVLGIFRRPAILDVGGYDARMATEDIDLSWRLLLAGWHTGYEPNALVGMQVPRRLSALWAQRRRWARGQGEVLRAHLGSVRRSGGRRLAPLAAESIGSLCWVALMALVLVIAVVNELTGRSAAYAVIGIAWGIAIAVVAMLQLAVAIWLERRHDPLAIRAFLLGPLYPLGYWLISAAAAIRSEIPALVRGPASERVAWDLPRDRFPEPGPPRE
jgi:biofilm PGA synthesis N-glycosyltransferase PgaC